MKKYFCLIAAFLLISASASPAQAVGQPDPFVGTWRMNVVKSTYPPGTRPRQMVIEMSSVADGVHYRSETTYANGRSTRSEYTADYTGREAIVTGSAGLTLPVSLKRVDANTVVARYMRGLQAVATSRRTISGSGRIMTIKTISPDKSGKSVVSIGVYEKTNGVEGSSGLVR
jgi:hypothetical protein